MTKNINKAIAKHIVGDTVRLLPACVECNDFHYGKLDDPEILGHNPGTIVKVEYDRHEEEMSYLVEIEGLQVDNQHWFLESELY